MPGVLHAQVVGVGVHGHDLLLDVLGLIRQVDAVAQTLAHLGLAVNAGQAQAGGILGQHDLRHGQGLAVDGVELVHDLAALLQHGHLILTGRHSGGTERRDIRCLADGVGEEATGMLVSKFRIWISLFTVGLRCRRLTVTRFI